MRKKYKCLKKQHVLLSLCFDFKTFMASLKLTGEVTWILQFE